MEAMMDRYYAIKDFGSITKGTVFLKDPLYPGFYSYSHNYHNHRDVPGYCASGFVQENIASLAGNNLNDLEEGIEDADTASEGIRG